MTLIVVVVVVVVVKYTKTYEVCVVLSYPHVFDVAGDADKCQLAAYTCSSSDIA